MVHNYNINGQATDEVVPVRHMRVYATPYAYTPNGAPLYIEYQPERVLVGEKRVRNTSSPLAATNNNLDVDVTEGPPRKSRLVWTDALHNAFVRAVHTLGVDCAVPKQILRLMGVRSLTRENIASHLQKYRAALKRDLQRRQVIDAAAATNTDATTSSSSTRRRSGASLTLVLNQCDRVLPPLSSIETVLMLQRDSSNTTTAAAVTPFSTSTTSTTSDFQDFALRPLLSNNVSDADGGDDA